MLKYPWRRMGCLLAALALGSCGGSDKPGNAGAQAKSFASGACKKERVAQSGTTFASGLSVIADETGLAGLRCVAWERLVPDELKLDLFNFDSACGAGWSGSAASEANGDHLALHVYNPTCAIAACGKCLYDWSFAISVLVYPAQIAPVDITVDACEGQQTPAYFSPTIGPEDKGMHCTFADYGAVNEQAAAAGTCGKAGWPCVGSLFCGTGSFTSTGTCDPGLVCDSSAAPNEPRCLVPCATTADCPRSDAWSCQSGLCRPRGM